MPRKGMHAKAVIAPAAVADDFKRIKGIGPAIEKRLHAAGILTFAELAKLTPVQVSERTGGLSAKIVAKERWIKQAAKLASESAARPLHRARFRIDLMLDDNDRVQYTRVKHIRHEEDEADSNHWDDGWGNWSEEKLINFVVQHAGIKPQKILAPRPVARTESTIEKQGAQIRESEAAQPPVEAATSLPLVALPLEVPAPITQSVERSPEPIEAHALLQPQASPQRPVEAPAPVPPIATPVAPSPRLQLFASAMQIFDSPIRDLTTGTSSVKHLRARFTFELSGAMANDVTIMHLPYFVQILACELSTGRLTVLATDKQMLRPGSMLYTSTADFAMPALGRYQTFGVIFLSLPDDNSIPDRARVDVAWGSVINIIP